MLSPEKNVDDSMETTAENETTDKDISVEIDTLTSEGFKQGMLALKYANCLPQDEARDLYCAYPDYNKLVDTMSLNILGTMTQPLKENNIAGSIQKRLEDEQIEMLQEYQDLIHEQLGTNLDKKAGLRRKQFEKPIFVEAKTKAPMHTAQKATASSGSWNVTTVKTDRSQISARLLAAKNIERPQIKFSIPVDNSTKPFVPKIKEKPNSIKPLALLPEYDDAGNITSYLHPYEFELMKFKPSDEQLQRKAAIEPKLIEETELLYVDTVPKLQQALEELRQQKEIAIDVEHHSYRTFMGITCLLQMSTRVKDYIFDALVLREDLHVLNLVLTDPKIVKILHGADLDIEWLQRDLALYIVNMMDTHRAAKELNMPRGSLAFILKHYVNIDAEKTFQLADWRMRPLPEELIAYARKDTHYLIYIYERMTNDLLDLDNGKTTCLNMVYQKSTEICNKRYNKPHIHGESHLDLVRKAKRVFDNRQLSALSDIFKWRDCTARSEDESYGYVLPNHMMLQIAESLPREMQGILACCNPVPPPVRQQLHALHKMVLKAREQPLIKSVNKVLNAVNYQSYPTESNHKLYCPQDLSHWDEFQYDLPTLIEFDNNPKAATSYTIKPVKEYKKPSTWLKPKMSFFNSKPSELELEQCKLIKEEQRALRMPYKRYLAILPIMEKERREEALRLHNETKKRQLCPATIPMTHIKEETNEAEAKQTDDLYQLPIKEQLKRKYQKTVSKENSDSHETANANKRFKKLNAEPTTADMPTTSTAAATASATVTSTSPKTNISTIDISDDDNEVEIVEAASTASPKQKQQQNNNKNNKQSYRNKRQQFKAKSRMHPQSSNKAITLPNGNSNLDFDYKKVDYKKFQGGAQRARGADVKSEFHGKNQPKKAQNKQFNKLFTFSNVKASKK